MVAAKQHKQSSVPVASSTVRALLLLGYGGSAVHGCVQLWRWLDGDLDERPSIFAFTLSYVLDICVALVPLRTMEGWLPRHVLKHHIPALALPLLLPYVPPTDAAALVAILTNTASVHECFGIARSFTASAQLENTRRIIGLVWFSTASIWLSYAAGKLCEQSRLESHTVGLLGAVFAFAAFAVLHPPSAAGRFEQLFGAKCGVWPFRLLHLTAFVHGVVSNV